MGFRSSSLSKKVREVTYFDVVNHELVGETTQPA